MKPKKRQKLCYNCEGEVDLDVIVCPYCAADLREEKPELQRVNRVNPMNTEQSLYPPPYSERVAVIQEKIEASVEEKEPSEWKSVLGPVALFALGVQLFVLGLALLFFSDHGTLILKWDARFWIFYVLTSAPLMYFGYRSLK